MDIPRKDLEKILNSLQPTELSPQALERLERTLMQAPELDASHVATEKHCQSLVPQALAEDTLNRLLGVVQKVPFSLDDKVVMFPGQTKSLPAAQPRRSLLRRYWSAAAVAAIGGLAALLSPPVTLDPVVSQLGQPNPARIVPAVKGLHGASTGSNAGFVATSYGSGIEHAADEGVIWTQDHQPRRVLRFQYQDRVLVRDKNGIDRMLLMPREELYVVPEKCD
jgi:hypothetical protein